MYVTYTYIFIYILKHLPTSSFLKTHTFSPQHFYKNLLPTSLKSNIFLHVFIVLTNHPTKQQPNNNQTTTKNHQYQPTTNNIQQQTTNTKHTNTHPRWIPPTASSTLGGCQGGVDQSIPEADCKGDDTWQGGVPPILLHCPPWEVARVEWTRAIQRQIARKMTPGRVVFLPSYCVSTLGGCQGGVDQRNPEADCKKVTPGRLDSSYCVPPIPILHKFQFSHMFFCRRPLL